MGRFILNLTCFGSFNTRLNENRRAFHRIPIRISSGKHFCENDQRVRFNGDNLLSSRLIEKIGRDGARERKEKERMRKCVCVCVCVFVCARMERQAISFARREKRVRKCYTLREREFIFFIFKLLNEKKKTKRSDKLFLCYYVSFFFILTSK